MMLSQLSYTRSNRNNHIAQIFARRPAAFNMNDESVVSNPLRIQSQAYLIIL